MTQCGDRRVRLVLAGEDPGGRWLGPEDRPVGAARACCRDVGDGATAGAARLLGPYGSAAGPGVGVDRLPGGGAGIEAGHPRRPGIDVTLGADLGVVGVHR
jgi:hypothetical protein